MAEQRDLGEGGFRYRTNDLVVAATGRRQATYDLRRDSASAPNAPLAHEVSHGWTMQATGPAANFLREGWATYCEWMFVGTQYGPQVETDIWQTAYNYYFLGGHNGVRSILGNPDNGSIHYVKGAWILHMLEEAMGQRHSTAACGPISRFLAISLPAITNLSPQCRRRQAMICLRLSCPG